MLKLNTTTFGTGLLAALLLLGGCAKNNSNEQVALLTEENQTLREQLADRNAALDEAYDENRQYVMEKSRLQQELDSARSQAMMAASAPAPVVAAAPGPVMTNAFDGIPGVTGSVNGGEVTATIESDVLFDPGKASLKPAAKKALNSVAQVLQASYGSEQIRITGHTDTDPIKKSGHKSNHHLGFERAYAVREYLLSRGVDGSRMYVASYGPDRALGTKAQSRRVEIAAIVN